MDQTEELELIEQYYRHTVAWAPSDEEALAIAQDLLKRLSGALSSTTQGTGSSTPAIPSYRWTPSSWWTRAPSVSNACGGAWPL